jgi:hypothetical protein
MVNVALYDYVTLIDSMKLVLKHIRLKIQAQKQAKFTVVEIHWEEVDQLGRMVGELEIDLRSFQRLLVEEVLNRNPNVRDKRGLINIFGYGMKYLFGTADVRDVKQLSAICDKLHVFETKMVHVAKQQFTYIRTLDETTKQNVKDTVDLARVLRDYSEPLIAAW